MNIEQNVTLGNFDIISVAAPSKGIQLPFSEILLTFWLLWLEDPKISCGTACCFRHYANVVC